MRRLLYAIAVIALLPPLMTGCQRQSSVEQIQQRGTLRVITRNSPTTYYQHRNGDTGFEYELARLFARDLGVSLDIRTRNDGGQIITALTRRAVDLAAAGMVVASVPPNRVDYGPAYMEVTQQLVYRSGIRAPRHLSELVGSKLVVRANSAQAQRLRELVAAEPGLQWEEVNELDVFDLLGQVNDAKIDFTIATSNEFAVNAAFFPHIRTAFDLAPPQSLVWFLPRSSDNSLMLALEGFFARLHESGRLERLREQYYGHVERLTYVGARTFIYHVQKRLPIYEQTMREAAEKYGLDWRLLAAVGYQESHWNPDAVSPTGVRGLMMLTRATAKDMGIKNRRNAVQSIQGGARYLTTIRERLNENISEPDRTWFTLAAYNVGLGHLWDAQELTERQGGDPTKWPDVMERLPLLQNPKWYKQTRYGYARGWEPVHYVQNIRRYYEVLAWLKRDDDDSPVATYPEETPLHDLRDLIPSVL